MLSYFRSREARPASALWNITKTLMQMVLFWTLFLFVIPTQIWWLESWLGLDMWRFPSRVGPWIGVILFTFGGVLGLTCAMMVAMLGGGTPLPTDCPRALVVVGPYRFIRNPMAIAGLSQAIAVGIAWGSPAVIVYGFIGGPIWNHFVRPWEEADLEQRFGDSYRHYRAKVWCWLPRLHGYRPTVNAMATRDGG